MNIKHAELIPFEPRFSGGKAYVQSISVQTELSNCLLRITTDDGLMGTGEVVRFPHASIKEANNRDKVVVKKLAGVNFSAIPSVLRDWNSKGKAYKSLSYALDCAWHDLLSQRTELPLSALLGGALTNAVPEILSLSAGTAEETVTRIRANAGATPVVQIKLGVDDLDTDLATVSAVLAALHDHQRVLADFNGALALDVALDSIVTFAHPQLMWEDPCSTYEENVSVSRKMNAPMLIDSSLWGLEMISRAVADDVKAVCIKPAKFGGLGAARAARDICVAAGMNIRIDGPWAGQHYTYSALALAVGVPAPQLIGCIDLTEPLETEHDTIARPAPGRIGPAC
ncbi:MAG: mandelate racemase/muconate lactonizing enzyme family protein [Pseudomonadota bacterium]